MGFAAGAMGLSATLGNLPPVSLLGPYPGHSQTKSTNPADFRVAVLPTFSISV